MYSLALRILLSQDADAAAAVSVASRSRNFSKRVLEAAASLADINQTLGDDNRLKAFYRLCYCVDGSSYF